MKNYELVLIVNPEIGEEETKKTIQATEKLFISLGGKVKKKIDWKKREFTYPIKKFNQGSYFLLVASLPPEALQKINKKLKLEENILRFLIVGSSRK